MPESETAKDKTDQTQDEKDKEEMDELSVMIENDELIIKDELDEV